MLAYYFVKMKVKAGDGKMEQGVTIFKTSGNDNEYIIRDKSGINIGNIMP